MTKQIDAKDLAFTTREVADLFGVTAKAVTRWCREGKIKPGDYFRTPGGQIRIKNAAVNRMMSTPAD